MISGIVTDGLAWLRGLNPLQWGIVVVVGLSGAMVAFYADASPVEIVLSGGAGLLLGIALTAYLTRIAPESGAYD